LYKPGDRVKARELLGLGEDCGVLIDAGVVVFEPYTFFNFWDLARHSGRSLAGARTLDGVLASRGSLHRMVSNGIDVPAAAAMCAHAFAHELMLTNLGNIPYASDFGTLKLEAIRGRRFLPDLKECRPSVPPPRMEH
jgi:hypothetical protein